MSSEYAFSSSDQKFSVRISPSVVQSAVDLCLKSYPNETGGVIAGRYDKNGRVALVKYFTPPPIDSKFSRTAFYRGLSGLKDMFLALWKDEEYYLGEWHYHPDASPTASSVDLNQMKEIANGESWRCPEPILIIVGRVPSAPVELGVYVYPKDKKHLLELLIVPGLIFERTEKA